MEKYFLKTVYLTSCSAIIQFNLFIRPLSTESGLLASSTFIIILIIIIIIILILILLIIIIIIIITRELTDQFYDTVRKGDKDMLMSLQTSDCVIDSQTISKSEIIPGVIKSKWVL